MNATRTFRPRASSPSWVDELSAIGWPRVSRAPTSTIGRWLMHVPWLLRTNFWSLYSSSSPASVSIRIRSAVTLVTTPARPATRTWPESRAARSSIPVPTLCDCVRGERLAALRHDRAGLGDEVPAELIRGDRRIVPGDRPPYLSVRGLDEAVAVDPTVGGEGADQADVRTFRRLDRADPAVVAVMDVADVEARALARQAARPEGRQAPLRCQLGERVRLVHELAQLAAAEELLHRRDDRPDVDQCVRGGLVDLLDRHPLADNAFHPEKADPEGVLDQLAIGPDAAVPEVVDIVLEAEPAVELDQMADDRRDVLASDRPAFTGQLDPHPGRDRVQLPVELVPADAPEVVTAEVEEEALDELAGVVAGRRIARAELLVDLDQRFLLRPGQVLVERVGDERMLGVRVNCGEDRADRVVLLVADGSEQGRRGDLALAVDLDSELIF